MIDGIDVRLRADAAFPIKAFDGKFIAFDESSFDVVMLVDVLHQTDDPMNLLPEAVRIARQAIVIKDHLMQGAFAYPTLRFMDWAGNARHGVALPYNYWTPAEWHSAFDKLGLAVTFWQSSSRSAAMRLIRRKRKQKETKVTKASKSNSNSGSIGVFREI